MSSTFSIPGRIELSATQASEMHVELDANFQYPRSDRVVCNPDQSELPPPGAWTFSIPGRIELSATNTSILARYGIQLPFSIPGRIELSATT